MMSWLTQGVPIYMLDLFKNVLQIKYKTCLEELNISFYKYKVTELWQLRLWLLK